VFERGEYSMSSEQENRVIVRRYFEDVFDGGDLDVADEVFDPEHEILNPHVSEGMRGPEPMKGLVWLCHKVMPDLEVMVEDERAEGEKVTTRWTLRGNLEDGLRAAGVGEQVTVSGTSVSRVIGGKIKETRLRCEADLQEPQRQVPRDEFRAWLREDPLTAKEDGFRPRSRSLEIPIPDEWASRFCCIFGLKFCCHEFQPPFEP